jgi:3D (Asp-Asp-Asp) domain-containing protein
MRYILFIGIITLALTSSAHAQETDIETRYIALSTHLPIDSNTITDTEILHTTTTYEKIEYKKFTINASAYTAAADECGKSDGITASGKKVKEDHTLACPREFAFGTHVHIEGMGVYTCEDRGGAIKGNKFDIYMETKQEAFSFGRQNLVALVMI